MCSLPVASPMLLWNSTAKRLHTTRKWNLAILSIGSNPRHAMPLNNLLMKQHRFSGFIGGRPDILLKSDKRDRPRILDMLCQMPYLRCERSPGIMKVQKKRF